MCEKAILCVSFGTSYPETRKKTIDAIEEELQKAFPDRKLYRAWTSGMIIRKLAKRDGVHIDTIPEAMKRMKDDGINDVIVQPTHVMNGIENDKMIAEISGFQQDGQIFSRLSFGSPLLTSVEDHKEAIKAVMTEWKDLPSNEALIFMGHGTEHHANAIYAALDYTFEDLGYRNVTVATVESYPSLDSVIRILNEKGMHKVHVAPFMIVAGDHANNDMSGDQEDSWKSRLERAGFTVECHLKGLGEYPGIRKMFAQHAKAAEDKNCGD